MCSMHLTVHHRPWMRFSAECCAGHMCSAQRTVEPTQRLANWLDTLYMVVSVPWHCKDFLQLQRANVVYVGNLMQATRDRPTFAFALGAIICQLCQIELQLADSHTLKSSGFCKQLMDAHVFEELLCTVYQVCVVSPPPHLLHH